MKFGYIRNKTCFWQGLSTNRERINNRIEYKRLT